MKKKIFPRFKKKVTNFLKEETGAVSKKTILSASILGLVIGSSEVFAGHSSSYSADWTADRVNHSSHNSHGSHGSY